MNNMRNKILSLLVLLLTAATGAWADKVQENISILAADWNAGSGTNVTNDGDLMKVILTSELGIAAYAWAQPVDLSNCDKLVVVVANMNGCDGEHYKLKAFLRDETNNEGTQMEAYVGLDDADNLQHEMVFDFTQQTSLDLTKVKRLGIQCQPNGAEYKISRVYIEKDAPKAEVEVTTNAASEGATFTEASFQMPAFDATADYELVRDMSVQMQAQVGDGTQAQPRYRVKKDGNNKFIPADMEMAAVPALFTVNDAIEQKALQTQDYIVQIYAIDAEGQPTGEPMTFATFTFEPGIYAVKAVAATGSDYDGETALSNTFKLFMGYEVEVAAKEFITYYKDEPLYADTETSADAQLYTIQSVSGDQAQLSAAIQTAPSYTPLLIFNNSDQDKTFLLIPANEEPSPISYYGGFIGTTDNATILASTEGTTNYALNGKAFVFVKNDLAIGPNKAWLSISNSNARSINLVFDSEATGISTTNLTNYTNGDWYDLNGRKLQGMPTKKGIYMNNGRKVVVK